MTVRVLIGDCREVLRAIRDDSVHCVVTSPPYWGLRDYGIPPVVWGGDPACEHDFVVKLQKPQSGGTGVLSAKQITNRGTQGTVQQLIETAMCSRCGAWRGAFGIEPTYQLYVDHAVEVFREVRRVLRPDGTLWLNMGDCYATGAGRVGEHPGGGRQGERWRGGHEGKHGYAKAVGPNTQPNRMPQQGLKPKDLVGIPWRVAFALQADGWWLRQDNVWAKPNPMPESVTDRTTRSHEYVFHLSKSERYHYDAEAIKEPANLTGKGNARTFRGGGKYTQSRSFDNSTLVERESHGNVGTEELLTRNKRSVWFIASRPFKDAHFATFPPSLVEPCVLAGCPPGGVVLDPFAGSGTVGEVAARLGRHAVLIEQSPSYVAMIERRCGLAPAAQAAE